MIRKIKIFDTTLRDGEQAPGCSMNLHQKIKVAQELQKLRVDVIEAGFAASSQADFEAVRQIAGVITECTVASLARALPGDIDKAWAAIKDARKTRIHTFIATSPIHMEYKLKKTSDEVYNQAVEMVKYAKQYCQDIEFSAEDATRSEPEFLYRIIEGVINAGATVVNIPDTVGYTTPDEFYKLIKGIKENVPNIGQVEISVHCHNDLGLAVANTLAAIRAGVDQVECTVNGIGERAGNAALEEVVMALKTRRDTFNADCGINTRQIYTASKVVNTAAGIQIQPNKAIVGANAFAHESGIHQHGMLSNSATYEIMTPESIGLQGNKMVLGKHSGIAGFRRRLEELGYNLSEKEAEKALKKLKELADKKKVVTDEDIEEIIASNAIENNEIYHYVKFSASIGSYLTNTATVTLQKVGNGNITEAATGDGPVDAACKAVNRIVGIDFELVSFKNNAITPGQDAQGSVVVEIRMPGKDVKYKGRGISTDIVEASIIAYVNAINKALAVPNI